MQPENEERRLRKQINLMASLGALAIVVILIVFAWLERNEIIRQMDIAQSRQVAARSVSARLEDNFDLAFLLGIEAINISETFEAKEALLMTFESSPHLRAYLPHYVDFFTFSPNGGMLASINRKENEIQLWSLTDTGTFLLIGQFTPLKNDVVRSLHFLSNEQVMIISKENIEFWDISTPDVPIYISEFIVKNASEVSAYSFNPAKKIFAVGYRDGQVVFWDFENIGFPFIVSRINIPLSGQYDSVSNLAFSSDGMLLAASNWSETVIIDMSDPGTPVLQENSVIPNDCAANFSPDKRILEFTCDEEFDLWDISNPAFPKMITEYVSAVEDGYGGEGGGGDTVAFNPADDRMIASANCTDLRMGVIGICVTSNVYLWHLDYNDRPDLQDESFRGHTGNVRQVEFSPDGNFLATLDTDGRLILWDVSPNGSLPPFAEVKSVKRVSSLAFSSDSSILISGDASGMNMIWGISEANEPKILSAFSTDAGADKMVISSDKNFLAISSDTRIWLWDIKNPASPKYLVEFPQEHNAEITDLVFGQKENLLYSSSQDGTIVFWSISNAGSVNLISKSTIDSSDRIGDVIFSPDGKLVVSGHEDGTIQVWKLPSFSALQSLIYPSKGYADPIDGLLFSPDGKILISTYMDLKEFVLWDFSDIKNIALIAEPLEIDPPGVFSYGIWNVSISGNNEILAASGCTDMDGSGDCSGTKLRLWDLSIKSSPRPLGDHLPGSYAHIFAISPDKKLLVSSEINGTVFWQMDSVVWRKLACDIVGRNFTQSEWTQYFPGEPYHITCPQWLTGQ